MMRKEVAHMNSEIYYVVKSDKTVAQAAEDLQSAVQEFGFGVLHIHDLGETLRKKGQEFTENCQVFEVCNPKLAAKVLKTDMLLNMALPCRISVFSENGQTKIGMIRPAAMLASLSQDPELNKVAQEVETITEKIIDAAR